MAESVESRMDCLNPSIMMSCTGLEEAVKKYFDSKGKIRGDFPDERVSIIAGDNAAAEYTALLKKLNVSLDPGGYDFPVFRISFVSSDFWALIGKSGIVQGCWFD